MDNGRIHYFTDKTEREHELALKIINCYSFTKIILF